MSKNVAQVFATNPVSTIGATDLLYIGQSGTTDAAINGTDFAKLYQNNTYIFGVDTGVADAYVVNLTPAITSYSDGMTVIFTPAHYNTTSTPTLSLNGLTAKLILSPYYANVSLQADDLGPITPQVFIYNLSNDSFVLQNPLTSAAQTSIIQQNYYILGFDSGLTNHYVADLSPTIAQTAAGLSEGSFYILCGTANTNTGASDLTVNGLGPWSIVTPNGSALVGGEIVANGTYLFLALDFASNKVMLLNSSLSGVTSHEIQNQSFSYAVDTGAANAYLIAPSPSVTSYVDGARFTFKASHANAAATTIDVNSLGAKAIKTNANAALVGGEILLNGTYDIVFNSTFNAFILMN